MPIMSYIFTKISAERKAAITRDDKIENGVKISDLKEGKIKINEEEQDALNVSFEFIVDYSKAGKLEILGSILYYETPEKIKNLLENWAKEKKVSPEFGTHIYNFILSKANIKALQLEEEVGLPLHLRLPRIKVKED